MKALIICSVHALCDISQLEREACNRACEHHGVPAFLTFKDHARLVSTTTMLGFLNLLPASKEKRERLIATYLDILNDDLWGTTLTPYKSVSSAILGPDNFAQQKGFVSDYPLLTTNIMRSAALLTNASRLGNLTALSDPLCVGTSATNLAACATKMDVVHHEIDVLVAHKRDFIAAQLIGMTPRYVKGLWSDASSRTECFDLSTPFSASPMNTITSPPHSLALPA